MTSEIEKQVGTIKSFDGTPIYYESRGKGIPIIFIYGIACQMNHWHHQINYFSKRNQVITFDLRGHHRSTPLNKAQNNSLQDLARDLNALMSHLDLESAHLVGHSFGATVILSFFELFPDKILSATFVNGFSRNPIHSMFGTDIVERFYFFLREQYNQHSDFWDTLWRKVIENPLSLYFAALAGGFNLKLTQFKDIEVYARGVSRIDLHIFFQLFDELMRYRGDIVLPRINFPVLIISGDKDYVTPKEFQTEFKQLIPHSKFVVVPYGSHCTQLDYPDYFNLILKEFLDFDCVGLDSNPEPQPTQSQQKF